MNRVFQKFDRFILFLLLGSALFVFESLVRHEPRQITVRAKDIAILQERWRAQTGMLPTASELNSLVHYHIREEILVREAQRLGLDRDDVILRRRLAQKMEMLIRDELEAQTSSEAELPAFFEANRGRYEVPGKVAFRHIFLGSEQELNVGVVEQLRQQLAGSGSRNWRESGKPFMLAREYGPRTHAAVADLFGTEFATRLMSITRPGDWFGPVTSAYGQHLVQVSAALPGYQPQLEEVMEQVAADYRAEELQLQEQKVWEDIRKRYAVEIVQFGETIDRQNLPASASASAASGR